MDFGQTTVSYEWDGQGWARSQDGQPHTDAEGVRVSPPNVILQVIGYKPSQADLASPEADVFGVGVAWLLIDGQAVEASWWRQDANGPTTYRDMSGEILALNQGRTWVELPEVGSPLTFQ